MMKKVKKLLQKTALLAAMLSCCVISAYPLIVYAAEYTTEEEELPESEAWDKLYAFGSNFSHWGKEKISNTAETVKEKAPGWKESVKEGISNAQEGLSDYRAQSEQSFWGHFEDRTGQETGLSGRDASDALNVSEPTAERTVPEDDTSEATNPDEADTQSKDMDDAEGPAGEQSVEESADQPNQDTQKTANEASAAHEEASQEARPEIETEPNRTQRFFDNQIVKIIVTFITIVVAIPCGVWLSRKNERRQK